MKRLFTAIRVQPGKGFLEVYDALRKGCHHDRITWVDPSNVHITLKFFGETEEDRIPGIDSLLQVIAGSKDPFEIQLKGTGVFGSTYKPRVVWIGIAGNSQFIDLGQEIIDRMEHLGFRKDRQNFVPHLTLGRIKHIDNKKLFFDLIEKYRETPISDVRVGHFHLIESQLSPQGPNYTILKTYPLKSEE